MSWDSVLKDKLRRYPHKDAARADCTNALREFSNLRPELDNYVLTNGKQQQLLALKGTIPVRYQGHVYNIPVWVWLLESHPFVPPMVFVKPTETMVIKQGRHVDMSGRVYLPYLHDWKYPTSDLYGLIQVLCLTFGEETPVISRQTAPKAQYGSYQGPSVGPHPPYPYGQGQGQRQAGGMPMQQGGPGMPMPMPMAYTGGSGYPPSNASGGIPPPYPNVSRHPSPGEGSYPPNTGEVAPYPSSVTTSYPTGREYTPYSTTETMATSSVNAHQSVGKTSSNARQDSLPDDAVRLSLLSAVEDKLSRRVKEVYEQGKNEITSITATKTQLELGSAKLRDVLDKISTETTTVENSNQIIEQKNQEMRELISKLESDAEKLNIDDAVVTTAPLYNQILSLFAEENAVEDAIYFIGEALRRDVLDLETFLKTVRKLSRKMFMLRAQLQKARVTAGFST